LPDTLKLSIIIYIFEAILISSNWNN